MPIRQAVPEDATAIARVRVETWRAAYHGLVPAAVLDAMDAVSEAAGHRARLAHPPADGRRELVAEVDGEIVGWAAAGPSVDDPAVAELYALYVLSAHWSTGTGHALLVAAEAGLRDAGFTGAVLWVLDGNERAARFYERHGWILDGGAKTDASLGGATGWAAEELRRRKDLA